MSIVWNEPTPPSGFPRSLMSYVQQANDLGNPLGGVGLFHMIHIGLHCHLTGILNTNCIRPKPLVLEIGVVMLLSELCYRSSEINSIIHNKAKLNLELLRVQSLFILFYWFDKISFSFLRVYIIQGSQRPKPFQWFGPKTNIKSKNGCNFWADTETNQDKQFKLWSTF